jgi:WD40 repeat protein
MMQRIKHLRFLILILFSLLGSVTLTMAQTTPTELVAVAWSPDGTMIAGGGTNGVLRVWDASTNVLLLDLVGAPEAVFAVAWSPDSTQLASGGSDGFTRLWNVTGSQFPPGHLIRELRGFDNIVTIDWSPDGTMLASGSISGAGNAPSFFIWETINYTLINWFITGGTTDIEWHPTDNYRIAFANQAASVFVFDPRIDLSSSTTPFLPATLRVGPYEPATEVSWNSDGSKFAFGGEFGAMYVIDANTGDILQSFAGHPEGGVAALAWTPDDRYIASGSPDNTIKVWDANTGALVTTYTLHKSVYPVANYIAWSPDGTQLVYGDVGDTFIRVNPPLPPMHQDKLQMPECTSPPTPLQFSRVNIVAFSLGRGSKLHSPTVLRKKE